MAKIDITEFKGVMPKLANDKLPPNMGQVVLDSNTESGALLPYKNALSETALDDTSYETLFEYIYSNTNNWVYFDGAVFWARSHVAEDTHERLYYMGGSGLSSRGTLTMDTNPTATDTMTIDTTVYEFVASATDPLDIEIGADVTETKTNVILAMRGTDGINVVHATVQPEAEWTGDDLILIAETHGTAGDSIVTTETFTAVTNVFDAVTLGTTVAGVADGIYKSFANDIDSSPWDFLVDFYLPGHAAAAAPTVTAQVSGATYLAYYYTYVSRYGEETAGSAITEITDQTVDNRVHVDDIATPTAGHGLLTTVGTSIPKVRVYRTATDGTGGAEFLMVAEADYFAEATVYVAGEYTVYQNDLYECTVGGTGTWAGGTHTFVQGEAVTVAELGLSTTGDSYLWRRAPDGLTNLRSHPNGFFVASKDNELHFSEPFYHHAWPEDYVIYLDAQIVGLGIFGSTVVVTTDANIYTFSGPHPDSLYKQRLAYQPCLSQRAVCEIDNGVMFPSAEGFQLVNAQGVSNMTAEVYKPDDLSLIDLDTMHAVWWNKSYYGFYNGTQGSGWLRIDMINGAVTQGVDYHYATYVTLSDGIFRTIINSNLTAPAILYISKWAASTTSYKNYSFKSRRYLFNEHKNLKVAMIQMDYDFYDAVQLLVGVDTPLADLNQAEWDIATALNPQGVTEACCNDFIINKDDVNGDKLYNLASLGIQDYVQFKIYCDSVLKFTKNVYDNKSFKLPRGFKNKAFEIEVSGMIPVKRIVVASSTEELKQ